MNKIKTNKNEDYCFFYLYDECLKIDLKLSKLKFEWLVLIFKYRYKKVNKAYREKFGYPLFLPLHNADEYIFKSLGCSPLDSQEEFDQQILYLVKLIIDSLNEKKIARIISPEIKKDRGISKLEELFKHYELTEYEDIIKFLRNLQELRSSGVAHPKGDNYDKLLKKLQIEKIPKIKVFENIMNQANAFLDYIESNLEKMN